MKRSVIAVVAAIAVLILAVTAVVAVTEWRQQGDAPGYGQRGMMSSSASGQGEGNRIGRIGPRAWMHGVAVGSEFEYLTEMVAHHREAVAAARQLQRSDRQRMREFGRSIVTTQSEQIAQMRRWLADWYPGRSTDVSYQPMMRDLTRLAGDRLDRVFLHDMTWHHMAAVMMSQQALAWGLAEHPQVNTLARSIRNDQHAEILQMTRWLNRWYHVGWMLHGGRWDHWNRRMSDWMTGKHWDRRDGQRTQGWDMGQGMMW
jgi:uncharacterized protein (DUF305 family)